MNIDDLKKKEKKPSKFSEIEQQRENVEITRGKD